jgi:hypothetical protein
MTLVKASGLTAGFVVAFAIGVWTSPYIRPAADHQRAAHVEVATPATSGPAAAKTAARRAPAFTAIPASSDAVEAQAKPLLNEGTDMALASDGFANAEQFVMVAHAARNTDIPFVVLKHRVLNERHTLTAAIRESDPTLNAAREVNQARAQARADLARLAG